MPKINDSSEFSIKDRALPIIDYKKKLTCYKKVTSKWRRTILSVPLVADLMCYIISEKAKRILNCHISFMGTS